MSSPTAQRSDSLASPNLSSTKHQSPQDLLGAGHTAPSSNSYRRGSTASIASSVGGPLDPAQDTFPHINDLAQNAISALLAHPIVRTGLIPQTSVASAAAHRPPTTRDIPPVTLTSIPPVDSSAFKQYLSHAGPLYANLQRARLAGNESDSLLSPRDGDTHKNNDFSEAFGRSIRRSSQTTSPTISRKASYILSPPQSPHSPRVSGAPRRNAQGPASLSTIPVVYFDENFHLENPRTFDIVSERSDVVPPATPTVQEAGSASRGATAGGRKALHTNAILQEKLSWYMDTVEIHLISSIATASTSFFAALGSLKELQSEAAESVAKIKELRSALEMLDSNMALGGLEMVNLRKRRENLRKLSNAVSQVSDIMDLAHKCEAFVSDSQLDDALIAVDHLERLNAGQPSHNDSVGNLIDLRRLKALDGMPSGIADLRSRIGKGYEARFIEALLSDLRQHIQNVPHQDTLQRWADASLRSRSDHKRVQSSLPAYMKTNDQLRPDLLAALAGLSKCGHTTRAATAYREAVMREVKNMIRRHLPSSSDDDAESIASASTRGGGRRSNQQEKSAVLARNLRALDPDAAEELFVNVYTSVGEALRRIGVQIKVLLDVTSSIDIQTAPNGSKASNSASNSVNQAQNDVDSALDLSSLLGQAVDVVQNQITKVLKVRSEQTTKLPLQQFLKYFTLNLLFANECEAVSGRSGEGHKEAINSQVRDFLYTMSESEKQRASQTLDSDLWDAKDFGPADKIILDRVLEGMTKTPAAWSEYSQLWQKPSSNGTINADSKPTENGVEKVRTAVVDEQKYILVESTLTLLRGVDAFENIMAGIPYLTVDAAQRLLEYLKAFNSRCCQLVLGAGATRSAGLKNITTRHLALASQTCSFTVAIIPYVREFVRRQSPAGSPITSEFDKVKRLFQDHQASIHEKLVDIMSQRSNAHVKAMKRIDWDASASEEGPSPYIEALTKETGTLHRVLSRHVGEMDLKMIMIPIFAHYRQEWTKAFEDAAVRTEGGKQRLLRDVELLSLKLSRIDGSDDLGAKLLQLVKDRKVEALPAASKTVEAVIPAADTLVIAKPTEDTTEGPRVEEQAEQKTPTKTPENTTKNEDDKSEVGEVKEQFSKPNEDSHSNGTTSEPKG